MTTLVLIKHAMPELVADVPSNRWVLSEEGRENAARLGDELRARGVARVYTSLEPKALETAALAAVSLGVPVAPRLDLHENDRAGLGFVSMPELRARIRRFFDEPSVLVMGNESADAAFDRFERALRGIAAEAGNDVAAVVTHGTVLTLLVSRYNAVVPFEFWDSLALPSCVLVDGRTFALSSPHRAGT
jgi:broad specificity phosphatase PhoE